AGAAGEAYGRLQADDAAGEVRTGDRAVRLGAEGGGAEVGGDGDRGAGAGAARVLVQDVRVAGLPAAGAPAATGVGGAKVGPLAQVCLAEQHGACLAELPRDRRVLRRRLAGGEPAGGHRRL